MSDLEDAKAALMWIKGEVDFIDSYFNGDFATWYNTIFKTRKRAKMIKEKCDIIIQCMNNMEVECERRWDEAKRTNDVVCVSENLQGD